MSSTTEPFECGFGSGNKISRPALPPAGTVSGGAKFRPHAHRNVADSPPQSAATVRGLKMDVESAIDSIVRELRSGARRTAPKEDLK